MSVMLHSTNAPAVMSELVRIETTRLGSATSANDPKRTFTKDVATVGISEETTSQSGA